MKRIFNKNFTNHNIYINIRPSQGQITNQFPFFFNFSIFFNIQPCQYQRYKSTYLLHYYLLSKERKGHFRYFCLKFRISTKNQPIHLQKEQPKYHQQNGKKNKKFQKSLKNRISRRILVKRIYCAQCMHKKQKQQIYCLISILFTMQQITQINQQQINAQQKYTHAYMLAERFSLVDRQYGRYVNIQIKRNILHYYNTQQLPQLHHTYKHIFYIQLQGGIKVNHYQPQRKIAQGLVFFLQNFSSTFHSFKLLGLNINLHQFFYLAEFARIKKMRLAIFGVQKMLPKNILVLSQKI
eukprot:TRINITY_DN14294_c0_g2_i1.p2 TRINITY_DN14294_c0_g2~~TRINITY_DN14294_c0_g2_i1.p2  ORF type:complete len:328 (-),score=-19.05 TRINITY_DN14294_c0_g2_i1:514-1398(-)